MEEKYNISGKRVQKTAKMKAKAALERNDGEAQSGRQWETKGASGRSADGRYQRAAILEKKFGSDPQI